MSDKHGTTGSRDTLLENFAAELTRAAYPLALRHGIRGSWLEVELAFWRALAATVKKWARERPPGRQGAPPPAEGAPTSGPPDEFKAWQEGLLMELTESAFRVAVKHGIQGSLLEVELGLDRAFRLVIRRRCGARKPD